MSVKQYDESAPDETAQEPGLDAAVLHMSQEQAQQIVAMQHLAGWLAQEQARLEHEMAYVREAAAHARSGLYAYLARSFGVDAAHEPLTIDPLAGVITRQMAHEQEQE